MIFLSLERKVESVGKEEIMDITLVCRSFPQMPKSLVERENVLDIFDTIFEGGSQLVVIEGGEGTGKTTLLAQFAKKYPNQTISLFIKPTSRWTYDPQFLLLDLCGQIYWALNKRELNDVNQVDDGFLRTCIYQLQGLTRQKKYYFLVDGIEDIPEEQSQAREMILEMLPFGLPGFHFLLSGEQNHITPLLPTGVSVRSYPLTGFNLDEAMQYMKDITDDRKVVEDIRRTFRGVPIFLATIRRIVQSGTSLEELLEDMPSKLPQFFEIEWRAVNTQDAELSLLLAVLSFSLERHSIQDLTRITHIPEERIWGLLQEISFIVISLHQDEITFVTEAFRKFAASRLMHLKDQVDTYLIDDLLHKPDSPEANTYLPEYFARAGRYQDLLTYLSPDDHFTKIVERNQSLGPVRHRADVGIETALFLNRDEDLIRFCIQRAAISDFDQAEIWRSEVEAYTAMHDYDAALALAQRTELKEDRLHLLAVIAKAKRIQGLPLEPELLGQIRTLGVQIDSSMLSEKRAIDIAADLIFTLPDIAIELVEKATHAEVDTSARDWAFAQLSLAAVRHEQEPISSTDTLERIRSHIENPAARHFSHAAAFLFQASSAQEVLVEVASHEANDRFNLLRLWVGVNRKREDALEVVDTALRLMIQMTNYSPNARVLRQLAAPLPYSPDITWARQLVGTFDSQKNVIEDVGPTIDYVRLQLLLARTESRYPDAFETVRNRFIELYFYILDINDLAVKTQCIAQLADVLTTVDPQQDLEQLDLIHSTVQDDLQSYVGQLLESTADHYDASQGILRILVKTYPEKALSLATSLNTEPRRDHAMVTLITSAVEAPAHTVHWDFIEQVLQHIKDRSFIDRAYLTIVQELMSVDVINDSLLPRLIPFLANVRNIQDAEWRCRACSLAYTFLKKHDSFARYTTLSDTLSHQFRLAWETIDDGWNKVNAGFELAKTLAETSQELARVAIETTENFKHTLLLEVPSTAETYVACLELAIRAYSGLFPQNLLSESDKERLTDYIDRVPSLGIRAKLWSILAIRHYIHKQHQECVQIVNEHVKPLLEDLQETNREAYYEIVSTVAPALYCAHQLTTLERVVVLPQPHRDIAYGEICTFLLQKLPSTEPFEALWGHEYSLKYEEVIELCSLLTHMEHDSVIYSFIDHIVSSILAGKKKAGYPRQQQQDMIERLSQIAQTKFFNTRYIQHLGYNIVARAQIARLQRPKIDVWHALRDEAHQIPNLSDKAYALSIIAVCMSQDSQQFREVLTEAAEIIETIPVHLEKMERYESLASMAMYIDTSLAKKYIEAAFKCFSSSDDPNQHAIQRGIIDIAYRLDPEYAAFLASSMDDDPARIEVKRQVRILEAKKRMKNTSPSHIAEKLSIDAYADAAWMSLGALNSGRMSTVHLEHTREFLLIAAKYPLTKTYPILAWIIENAIKRFATSDLAKTHLRSVYYATLLGVELTGKMALHSSDQARRAKDYAGRIIENSSIIINSGTREATLNLFKNWFEKEVKDYVIIADPFFGPDDLEILNLLNAVNPSIRVEILTSRKHHKDREIRTPWEDAYRDYWLLKVSDQQPPFTEIVIVGTQRKHESPIHDRWLLTNGGGLRIGTSINSLGITKTSEISRLSPEEAEIREAEVNQYIQLPRKQEHEGDRLLYTLFNL